MGLLEASGARSGDRPSGKPWQRLARGGEGCSSAPWCGGPEWASAGVGVGLWGVRGVSPRWGLALWELPAATRGGEAWPGAPLAPGHTCSKTDGGRGWLARRSEKLEKKLGCCIGAGHRVAVWRIGAGLGCRGRTEGAAGVRGVAVGAGHPAGGGPPGGLRGRWRGKSTCGTRSTRGGCRPSRRMIGRHRLSGGARPLARAVG